MMTTQEVANRLVELCRNGQVETAQNELFAEGATSREPAGAPMEYVEGRQGIIEKGKVFQSMVEEFHGQEISDPQVSDQYISVRWSLDVTMKDLGRQPMNEICLYKVVDGKIVSEQFFY
jgi:hypothetical protein